MKHSNFNNLNQFMGIAPPAELRPNLYGVD
jgi:hypothetical protein